MDLESEGQDDISVDTLKFIHTRKTGALLETSVVSGAILAGASEEEVQRLSQYAQNIGLAFQIVDDILDITSTKEELGKTSGKDLRDQKPLIQAFGALKNQKTSSKLSKWSDY